MQFIKDGATSRCCSTCYHYGHFLGYDGLTCELTGSRKRRPENYTNCKNHGYVDGITGLKVNADGSPWTEGVA